MVEPIVIWSEFQMELHKNGNYENALIRLSFEGQGLFTLNSHQKNFQANRSNGLGFLAVF